MRTKWQHSLGRGHRPVGASLVASVLVVLVVGAGAWGQTAELRDTGDIAAADGTLTITCSSTTPGSDVWQLTLQRNTGNGGRGAMITGFDDLTDTGSFNYCQGTTYGLFACNWIRNDGADITIAFEEVARTTSMYQYRITSVKGYEDPNTLDFDPNALEATYLYTINAATAGGTQMTCERTVTNTYGVELPGSVANDRMPTELHLYHNDYEGDYLTDYADVGGVWTRIHKLDDDSNAIWKVTDNIINTDANPFWGQGEVMASSAASALGLKAGRTFKITSDMTSSGGRMVMLWINAPLGLFYRIAYQNGFGQPNPIPVAWSADYDVTLDINVTDEAPGVGEPHASRSSVAVSPDSLTANGFNTTTVTVTLRDAYDYLVGGKAGDLTIEATDTGADNAYGTVTEKSEGVYERTIASSTPEVKTVTATYKKGDPDDQVILDQQPTVTFTGLPDAQLTYSGDDISGADGLLTITSSDRTLSGNVWEIDLRRNTSIAYRGAYITRFDDLTDSGDFNYCGGGTYGMFSCNNIRNDGAGITMVFEELYKGTDQYTYKLTSVKSVGVSSSVTGEYVYTINPATPGGTALTCVRKLSITGDEVVAADLNDRMPTEMYLNDNNYEDDYLSDYVDYLGFWTSWHLLSDDSDAIWEVTDNIENRDAEAMWGQGKVVDSTETQALNLVPGRTFTMTTDITSAVGVMVLLHPTAGVGLDFRAAYANGFGQPSPLPPDYAPTLEAAMHVNLTDEPVSTPVLDIDAALDWNWVYQNTETTTADGHVSTLTITLVSEAEPGETYDVLIQEGGGAMTNFTVGAPQVVGSTLVVSIIGGRVGTTAANAPGTATLTVTVTGQSSGKSDSAIVSLQLRKLGDLDGSGGDPVALDKQNFNKRLNGIATGLPDRAFDLNASDGEPNAVDKQIMNNLLNGVALP